MLTVDVCDTNSLQQLEIYLQRQPGPWRYAEVVSLLEKPQYRVRVLTLNKQSQLASDDGLAVANRADAASQLCGFYICTVVADECELIYVEVAPTQRRKGYGRLLIDSLIDSAEFEHCQTIFLEVRASNTAALALYEAMGFETTGRRPAYYPAKAPAQVREDALLLRYTAPRLAPRG